MPFGEANTDRPEQLKRQRRGNLYARFVFIAIVLFLVVHRIVIIGLAGLMFNSHGPGAGAAGMVVIFGDPLGTIAFLALAKVVPESALYPVYLAATIFIDSLIIYFFWRALRYAFINKKAA